VTNVRDRKVKAQRGFAQPIKKEKGFRWGPAHADEKKKLGREKKSKLHNQK